MIISVAPFRATSNIANMKIDGLELDTQARLAQGLDVGASIGVTRSRVQGSPVTTGPFTPEFTSTVWLGYEHRIAGDYRGTVRIDYRHNSSQFLGLNDQYRIGPKDYIDLRTSIGRNGVTLTGYTRNLLDQRQAFGFENVGFGFLCYNSNPRSYGTELAYSF